MKLSQTLKLAAVVLALGTVPFSAAFADDLVAANDQAASQDASGAEQAAS